MACYITAGVGAVRTNPVVNIAEGPTATAIYLTSSLCSILLLTVTGEHMR